MNSYFLAYTLLIVAAIFGVVLLFKMPIYTILFLAVGLWGLNTYKNATIKEITGFLPDITRA